MTSASARHNVDEFVVALQISMVKWTNVKKVTKVRKVNSGDDVAQKTVEAYKKVLEICVSVV